MKKLLNISVIAALAILPVAANAAVVAGDPTPISDPNLNPAQAADAVTATDAPKYALAVSESNDGKVATAGYVKGAYNAAIKAVNNVAGTLATVQSTANNAVQSVTAGSTNGTIVVDNGSPITVYNDSVLSGKVSNLETAVGDANSGLVQDVNGLKTTVGDANSGLVQDVNGLKTTVGNSSAGLVKDVADNASAISSLQSNKADAATTLSGYGITDAYTKTEVDTALAGKASTATTLAGYGITNAYTKTETATGVLATIDAATVPVMATWGSNTATTVSVDAPAQYLESAPVVP